MSGPQPCRQCGAEVVWARQYNGSRQAFTAEPITPTEGSADLAARWYAIRGRGMVSGDMLDAGQIATRPYLTRHGCIPTIGDTYAFMEVRNIPDTIRVEHLVLDSRHEYTYRWPTHWAHVLRDQQYHALCSAAMPEGRRTGPRERARLRGMPVCPKCIYLLDLDESSPGRALLDQVRERFRHQAEDAEQEITPQQTGFHYFRARFKGMASPVHTADCPTLRTSRFVPFEWSMTEAFPAGCSPCSICQPITGLDDLHERHLEVVHQVQLAAAIEDKRRSDRRAKIAAELAALGTFVYRPKTADSPASQVHHHACGNLASNVRTDGWIGCDQPPSGLPQHSCTTYQDIDEKG